MIIGICSDKGSPGATTLAVVLGMVWPAPRVVLECDPAGADLPFRMRSGESGDMLLPEPSVAAVAAAARLHADPDELDDFAQPTSLGIPVIPGMLTAERAAVLRGLWPTVADLATRWHGAVITDLGRLQPGSPVLTVAQSAAVNVLVSNHSTEGLYHLRERVGVFGSALADLTSASRLTIVITGHANQRRDAIRECQQLLGSVGSAAPIAGFLPLEHADLSTLWAGTPNRRLLRSPLMKAARHIAAELLTSIPAREDATPSPSAASTGGA